MLNSIASAAKLQRVTEDASAATGDIACDSVDTQGFHSVCFVVMLGTVNGTAVPSVRVQQSDDDGVADDFTDLAGTKVSGADTDDNKLLYVEVEKARKRYLRAVIGRETAAVAVDGAVAILHKADGQPAADDSATVVAGEHHLSPAEGTA